MRPGLDVSDLLKNAVEGECSGCGKLMYLLPWVVHPVRCNSCTEGHEAELRAAAAKASADQVLAESGTPLRLRKGWGRSEWCERFGLWPERVDDWDESRCVQTFFGSQGSGKSGAAAIVLHEHAMLGQSVRWIGYDSLIESERSAVASKPEAFAKAAELSAALVLVDVLVIDDLSRSCRPTPWEVERSARLIARRFDECRRTIVTTNIAFEAFAEWAGPLSSRLNTSVPVWFGGDKVDRR